MTGTQFPSSHHKPWTVARYLARRLDDLEITHLFGVPGNHLGPFLSTLKNERRVQWVGNPTEGGAGQAADAYARVHGVGAAAVTYGVGSFNLLNAIGGAYTEYVPLIAINAMPTYQQWQNYRAVGLLTSHMSQRPESNLEVYRQVTVDAQTISHPGMAPAQIDNALTACLSERRPVYLEVMEDVWDAPCAAPEGDITAQPRPATDERMLTDAVRACVHMIKDHCRPGESPQPILWAGEEIQRFGLSGELTALVRETGIPFCTTIGAKGVVAEKDPAFHGVYNGKASDPPVRTVFREWATCRIGLGSWSTSKNLEGERAMGDDWSVAVHGGFSVGSTYFPDVPLRELIPALKEALKEEFGEGGLEADYFERAGAAGHAVPKSIAEYRATLRQEASPPGPLTYDGLFARLGHWLSQQDENTWTLVSDAGFSLLSSMNVEVPQGGYVAQNSWLSIGWSVGAATGVSLADEEPRGSTRPMVFVGDGSFQETCPELSTHTRLELPTVVFVMDNQNFYGIEQMLVHPCYYRNPHPSDGADFYNVLHPWQYEKLAEVFRTGKTPVNGVTVADGPGFDALLDQLADPADPLNDGPLIVRLKLSRHDYPRALQYKVDPCP